MMRCCTCRHVDVPPDQPPCVDGCESEDCPYWEEVHVMITEGEQGIAFEVDSRRINPEGVYRRMQETGHCPLRDYDIERLGRAFGLYVGSMRQFIKKNGLDARLEDEVMGKVNYSEVEDLYNQGKSDTEIAKALKISLPSVGMWRKRNGLTPNAPKLAKQPVSGYQPIESIKTNPPNVGTSVHLAPASIDMDKAKEAIRQAVVDPGKKPAAISSEEFAELLDAKDATIAALERGSEFKSEIIDHLQAERLVLIGIAIGSGRYDAELVQEVIDHA